jgi:hypothetical protein
MNATLRTKSSVSHTFRVLRIRAPIASRVPMVSRIAGRVPLGPIQLISD